jgi:aspartate/methionine/tyrosine aminotransferase
VNAILAEVRECQTQGKAQGNAQGQAQERTLISLMRGEPDLKTPAHIVEACTQALRDGRTAYPDNRGERGFREAVALKLDRDNGGEGTPRVSFASGDPTLARGLDQFREGLLACQQ